MSRSYQFLRDGEYTNSLPRGFRTRCASARTTAVVASLRCSITSFSTTLSTEPSAIGSRASSSCWKIGRSGHLVRATSTAYCEPSYAVTVNPHRQASSAGDPFRHRGLRSRPDGRKRQRPPARRNKHPLSACRTTSRSSRRRTRASGGSCQRRPSSSRRGPRRLPTTVRFAKARASLYVASVLYAWSCRPSRPPHSPCSP